MYSGQKAQPRVGLDLCSSTKIPLHHFYLSLSLSEALGIRQSTAEVSKTVSSYHNKLFISTRDLLKMSKSRWVPFAFG
jgi:hypothetical protein